MRQDKTFSHQEKVNNGHDLNQLIPAAIENSRVIKPEPSHIRKQLFQLTREIKTIVGFDEPIHDGYKKIVMVWQSSSSEFLKDESLDILWAQFKTSWNKIKYSTKFNLFNKLADIAFDSEYPPVCDNYEDVAKDLIRLCAVLDAHWSPEPFFLSCRMAKSECGYSHAKMAKLLELFVLDGVLELVAQGTPTGRASRYRFIEDRGKIDLRLIKSVQHVNKEIV